MDRRPIIRIMFIGLVLSLIILTVWFFTYGNI